MPRLPGPYDLGGVGFGTRAGIPSGDAGLGAIASSVRGFGSTLAAIGADQMQQVEQTQRENTILEGTASDGGALKDLSDFERGFDADSDFGTFQPRFEKGVAGIRDKWAAKLTDPKARQLWAADFDKTVLATRNRVIDLGQKRIREGKLVEAKTGLEGYQSVIADDNATEDQRADAKKRAEAAIAAQQRNGLLTPVEADDWRTKVIKGGEFVLAQRQIAKNPEIITGKLPAAVSDRSGIAMGYLQSRGWTKEQAAGIVGNLLAESSLNTSARNSGDGRDGSDSIGVGQWNSTRARALMKFAGNRGKDWRDFETQLAFVDWELNNSHKSVGDRLRAARDIKEATHAGIMYEGPAGSQNGPENAHNYKGRMTFAAQAAGETVRPDWFVNQSPEDQLKLENLAAARQGEIDRETRVSTRLDIETAAANAPSAIQATGLYSGPMPTPDQFALAYGEEGPQKFRDFQQAVDTSEVVFGMKSMPNDEIKQVVADAVPTSSGTDAALQAERYRTLSAAADFTLKAREADPATYVQNISPTVSRAWQDVEQSGGLGAQPGEQASAYRTAISASVAAQEQLGITNIQPLAKPIAAGAVATFKDVNLGEQDRIGAVANVLMATDDPQQRRALFEQLVDAGLPDITEGAFLAMERGDEGAARRLFQAAVINPADLPGKIDATPAEINQEIQDTLMAEGQIGDVYYGLSDGTAQNFVRAERDSKLLSNAVQMRIRGGETLEQAVVGAGEDLIGKVKAFTAPNVQILFPADQDATPTVDGLQRLLPRVRQEIGRMFPPKTVGAGGAIVDAAANNRADDVLGNGYFRNSGDGYVFIDTYTGSAIPDENGEPIIFHPLTVDALSSSVVDPSLAPDANMGIRDALMGGPAPEAKVPTFEPRSDDFEQRTKDDTVTGAISQNIRQGRFTGKAPAALKAMASTALGDSSVIDEKFFSSAEMGAIKTAVRKAVAEKTNQIGYGDYGEKAPWAEGTAGALNVLTDPAASVAFTLGMAKVTRIDDETFLIEDDYDYNAKPDVVEKAKRERGVSQMLMDGLVGNGLLGVGNVVGNLIAPEGQGRKVAITVKIPKAEQ